MERLKPSSIVVFVPNWVGDAVMATPALSALRSHLADARIVALARPYVCEVLAGLDVADEIRALESLESGASVRALLADARELRRERFDLAVVMTNSFRTAMFAALAGVRERVGYGRDGRWMLLTKRLKAPVHGGRYEPRPMIDYYLALAESLGVPTGGRAMRLAVTREETTAADDILERFGVDSSKPIAVINPGAAFGSAKCWPPENFAAVADALAGEGMEPLVVTAPKERSLAEKIAQSATTDLKTVWRADVPLGSLKSLISRAAVLVTNDSGPRHFGAALGAAVVTIMGPTDPRWSNTGYDKEIILNKNVDCAPCMLRVCPRDHSCMTLITPGEVIRACRDVMDLAPRREVARS